MKVFRQVDELIAYLSGTQTVVTIGMFDGVHLGHQEILRTTVELAKQLNLPAIVLTFDPHPRQVHQPEQEFTLVSSLTDRLERLAAQGIDMVIVQTYSLDFAKATPREFIVDYLVGQLQAKAVVVGQDVRFGLNNAGDAAVLVKVADELGVLVTVVQDVTQQVSGRRWSSTWVREALAAGDVQEAQLVLGHPHRLRGLVKHGARRGRTLGYPTANLDPDDLGVLPVDGVYAGWLLRPYAQDDKQAVLGTDGVLRLPAAISVGTNTTFGEQRRTVEAHVLGRTDLDLYGEEVVVELVKYLRPMITFRTVADLLAQMEKDVATTAHVLSVPVPAKIDPAAVTA